MPADPARRRRRGPAQDPAQPEVRYTVVDAETLVQGPPEAGEIREADRPGPRRHVVLVPQFEGGSASAYEAWRARAEALAHDVAHGLSKIGLVTLQSWDLWEVTPGAEMESRLPPALQAARRRWLLRGRAADGERPGFVVAVFDVETAWRLRLAPEAPARTEARS